MSAEIVLIGGVSGSGKSVALGALEDAGYYTVNNLPLSMLPELIRHVMELGFERIGATIDSKSHWTVGDLKSTITQLRVQAGAAAQVRFIFLDAKADTLVKRYSET